MRGFIITGKADRKFIGPAGRAVTPSVRYLRGVLRSFPKASGAQPSAIEIPSYVKGQTMRFKKAFLILAFVMVSVIALLYGINPRWFARTFLGVDNLSVNFAHILRAVMCLYLALGCFWLFSAFSDKFRDTGILTTIMFAGGLVIGRLLSFIIDGQPAPLLILYGAVELAIVPIAWWIYAQPDERIPNP